MSKKKHEAEKQCSPGDLERVISDLYSSDDETRAKAVSSVCPCRMGFEGFQRAMDIVATMRKDPSPKVRGAALHVIEEAYHMTSSGQPTSKQMVKNEMKVKKNRNRWGAEA